jgi:serine/threonine protein kinase
LRLSIIKLNKNINTLLEEEADLLEEGEEEAAEEVGYEIDELNAELYSRVENLKTKQQYYIDKRSFHLTNVPIEKMIAYLKKIGVPYPDDDVFAMKQVLMDDKDVCLRLQDEFRSLKLVQHPNILQVFSMGEDYYIMEYIRDTVEPEDIVIDPDDDDPIYTNEDRIQFIIEAAKAVERAHLFGVIHRDIKPENIAIDMNGNVKLMDFGLAKSAETEGITQTGVAIGTPHFMSPEQIESTKEAATSFDIYSLGATLYTYITGTKPYEKAINKYSGKVKETKSAQDVFMTVCNQSFLPIPPTDIAPGIPKVLEDITLKAMEKERAFRYQSIAEFRDDLEQYLELADKGALKAASYFGIGSFQVDMQVRRRQYRSAKKRSVSRKSTMQKTAVWIMVCAVLAAALAIFVISNKNKGQSKDLSKDPKAGADNMEGLAGVKEMFEYAEEYASKNPFEFRTSIDNFRRIEAKGAGTAYELKAHNRIKELKETFSKEKEKTLSELKTKAGNFRKEKKFDKAVACYRDYNGVMAQFTEREREQEALKLVKEKQDYLRDKKKWEEAEAERLRKEKIKKAAALKAQQEKAKGELPRIAHSVTKHIKEEAFDKAESLLKEKLKDEKYSIISKSLNEMNSVVRSAQGFKTSLKTYLQSHQDKEVKIYTRGGKVEQGVLSKADDDECVLKRVIEVEEAKLTSVKRIKYKDIPFSKRIAMVKPDMSDTHMVMALYLRALAENDTDFTAAVKDRVAEHLLFIHGSDSGEEKTVKPKDDPEPKIQTTDWIDPFSDENKEKIKTAKGARYSILRSFFRFNRPDYPIGFSVPEGTIEYEFEARFEGTYANLFIRGVRYSGDAPNIRFLWYYDGNIILKVNNDKSWERHYTHNAHKRKSGSGWHKFAFTISDNRCKGIIDNETFYDGPIPEDFPREMGFELRGKTLEVRNAKYRVAGQEGKGHGWISLIQGNSKQEADWYATPSEIQGGIDVFEVQNNTLTAPLAKRGNVWKKVNAEGNYEIECDYKMEGSWLTFLIDDEGGRVFSFALGRAYQGKHSLKLEMKGTRLRIFMDREEVPMIGPRRIQVTYRQRNKNRIWETVNRFSNPVQGLGRMRVTVNNETSVTIANMRYRVLQ